jgi:hypothetical protein
VLLTENRTQFTCLYVLLNENRTDPAVSLDDHRTQFTCLYVLPDENRTDITSLAVLLRAREPHGDHMLECVAEREPHGDHMPECAA